MKRRNDEIISYERARLMPLVTDVDIENRVAQLIGRACSRQLWLFFLADDAVQLPLLVPIAGLPSDPSSEGTSEVMSHVAEVMEDVGAAALVLVWERYAAAALTQQDAAWARALHDACVEHGIALRAILLSHRTGVRWMAEDDYLFAHAAAG